MKKTISILMILLLFAVACMGFVACNETPSEPVDSQGQIDIEEFLVDKEFSFGKIEKKTGKPFFSKFVTQRVYPKVYDLYVDGPAIFDNTMASLQTYYNKYVSAVAEMYLDQDVDLQLGDYLAGEGVVIETRTLKGNLATTANFAGYEVGDFVDAEKYDVDSPYFYSDMVHEVYSLGEYHVVFASAVSMMSTVTDCSLYESQYSFYTMIYKDGDDSILVVQTSIQFERGFYYPMYAIAEATPEERAAIASFYQEAHKEIVTAWIENNQ